MRLPARHDPFNVRPVHTLLYERGAFYVYDLLTETGFWLYTVTPMATQGYSINDTAKELGISTRTVRRFIKAGKLKADLVPGTFGPEYRIAEIPEDLRKQPPEPESETETESEKEAVPAPPSETAVQTLPESPDRVLAMLKDLQEKNMALAAQLGVATERIRNLENQVRLLNPAPPVSTNGHKSFWQRLVALFTGKS